MRRKDLLGIINSLLGTNNTCSLESIITPDVIVQVEKMRDDVVLALENNTNNLSEINFTPNDTIDDFQKKIYSLDEILSEITIKTEEQLENLVVGLNNMLDYITHNKEIILSLESIKLNNIKNNFRAIQTIIKNKITINSEWLNQIINRYNQVYSYIIPSLPHFINPKKQTDYLNDLDFENFNNDNKTTFTTMIQDLRNICSQVIENTDSFKNLQENELYELQHSLEKLLNVINTKLYEIDTKKEVNTDNLFFPKSALTIMLGTIKKTKEKVIRSIRKKEVEKDLKSHIETFPDIKKESIMDNIGPYKKFIAQINEIYNFIIGNKDILWEINQEYIIEIIKLLKDIKEKLDYVITEHNPNNIEHIKFFFPANRLSTLIDWLIEKLDFSQVSFQN